MDERFEPRYFLNKFDGARRQIHSCSRMFWANEDPLVINLIAQSVDRLTADLCVKKYGRDLIWDSPWIVQKQKSSLLKIVREASNFAKHADLDSDGQLGIFNLQGNAEFATFFSILRYRELSNSLTCHMKLYLGYFNLRYPDCMTLEGKVQIENLSIEAVSEPAQLRRLWGEAALLHSDYCAEYAADKLDSA